MGALNIKDPAVAAKAGKSARMKGTSITAAVGQALDASLAEAAPKAAAREEQERRVDAIVERFRSRMQPGGKSPHSVIADLYDAHGAPK